MFFNDTFGYNTASGTAGVTMMSPLYRLTDHRRSTSSSVPLYIILHGTRIVNVLIIHTPFQELKKNIYNTNIIIYGYKKW